jgi:prepilin-type processing-associated H-X9-DG protein
MLLPALGKARQSAYTIGCASNLKQIGGVMAMYSNDNEDYILWYNNSHHWWDFEIQMMITRKPFSECNENYPLVNCPAVVKMGFSGKMQNGWFYWASYGCNRDVMGYQGSPTNPMLKSSRVKKVSETATLFDARLVARPNIRMVSVASAANLIPTTGAIGFFHNTGSPFSLKGICNVLLLDGHVGKYTSGDCAPYLPIARGGETGDGNILWK